jgi:hypothetical protein
MNQQQRSNKPTTRSTSTQLAQRKTSFSPAPPMFVFLLNKSFIIGKHGTNRSRLTSQNGRTRHVPNIMVHLFNGLGGIDNGPGDDITSIIIRRLQPTKDLAHPELQVPLFVSFSPVPVLFRAKKREQSIDLSANNKNQKQHEYIC